jgi:A/G-specific adenine glycosylase
MDFASQILKWYRKEKRNLPWRHTKDPYLIWLSEVILQQTRVDQGMDYYLRFSEKYPDIKILAEASEQEILKMWQGLGYYSRARNMLFAARQLMSEFNGVFPQNYEQIRKLKGVGEYTAAAIASIAFGQRVAVVDGNVKRVISRLFGLENTGNDLYKKVKQIMTEQINFQPPGDFNQAVMEFGALYCVPKNPLCDHCIFSDNCVAREKILVERLPVKVPGKKPKPRYFSYLVINIREENSIVMRKRDANDIWKNLYDFPLIETSMALSAEDIQKEPEWDTWFGKEQRILESSVLYRHQLTHRTIIAQFHFVDKSSISELTLQKNWEIIALENINRLPLPRLIERFVEEHLIPSG